MIQLEAIKVVHARFINDARGDVAVGQTKPAACRKTVWILISAVLYRSASFSGAWLLSGCEFIMQGFISLPPCCTKSCAGRAWLSIFSFLHACHGKLCFLPALNGARVSHEKAIFREIHVDDGVSRMMAGRRQASAGRKSQMKSTCDRNLLWVFSGGVI